MLRLSFTQRITRQRLLSCLFREFHRDIFGFATAGLFDIDLVTDQPQLKLVERGFPAHLEIPHPLAIFVRVFDVDYYFGKRVV